MSGETALAALEAQQSDIKRRLRRWEARFEEAHKQTIAKFVLRSGNDSLSLVIADARGVNVGAMTSLRSKARSEGVELRVVRNTLARRAFVDTEYACVEELLVGPSLFAFSMEDPGAGARIFKEFSKENEDFEIKALSVGGKLLGSESIDVLANLPTLEQALGMLASVALAPVINIVRTLNEVPTQVTRTMAAIRDQKGEAA